MQSSYLVAGLDQVITQLFHRVRCRARLHTLRVVRDEDGLLRFDNDYAFPSLYILVSTGSLPHIPPSPQPSPPSSMFVTHLLSVDTPIVRLQHDKPLTRHVQTRALHLLHAILSWVLVRGDNLLHLLRTDCEARGRRPDAVAFGVEDGRFVEVAGADKAVGKLVSVELVVRSD